MSLGPPFDHSGERLQLQVGAAAVILLGAAVAVALLASDRTLGEAISVRILLRSPGALRTGAHVQLAGHQIGEVVAIRGAGWLGNGEPARAPQGRDLGPPRVELEARILRAWRPYIHRNSTFFASTPNVLTEAELEVGPPPGGEAPGPLIEDGEQVRGVDPPEIDRFLATILANLTAITTVSQDLRPDWDQFREAMSRLLKTLGGLTGSDELARIASQWTEALRAGHELALALQRADAVPQIEARAQELSRALTELGPQLRRVAAQMGVVQDRLTGITSDFGPVQRRQLEEGVALFRRVLLTTAVLGRDVRWLKAHTERGGGTIGGLLNDIQIYDELKETFRIVKQESWRLIFKGRDRGQRGLR